MTCIFSHDAAQIANSKSDIENFNRQGETMDIQRKNAMKDLEEQLQTAEGQAAMFSVRIEYLWLTTIFLRFAQEKHQAASSTLDQLKLSVDALFAKIKCDKACDVMW